MMARRRFLAISGCAAAGAVLPARTAVRNSPLIWLVNSDLLAEESALGFVRAAPRSVIRRANDATPFPPSSSVIVPACQQLTPAVCSELKTRCEEGSLVLLESALTFVCDPECRSRQNLLLEKYFGIRTAETPSADEAGRYVSLHWPVRVRVRSFGAPCAVSGGTPVGTCSTAVVAQTSVVGRGQIVLLSSLLGPHLLAGDIEAHAWLHALLLTNTDERFQTYREKEL